MKAIGDIKGSGIYMIKNILTSDIYIGRSINMSSRFSAHLSCFRGAETYFLYENMRLHGIENFEFSVLEKVEGDENLDEREIFWFEQLNPYYNTMEAGKSRKSRKIHLERRKQLREEKKADVETQKRKSKEKTKRKPFKKTFLCMNCGNNYSIRYDVGESEWDVFDVAFKSHNCGISIMNSPYLAKLEKERKLLTK